MTVTATSSKVNDPKPSTPVEVSLTKMIQDERNRALKEEKQGDADTANLGPKIPTTDHIRTNVKLNLDLDRLDSPLRDNQSVISEGCHHLRRALQLQMKWIPLQCHLTA